MSDYMINFYQWALGISAVAAVVGLLIVGGIAVIGAVFFFARLLK